MNEAIHLQDKLLLVLKDKGGNATSYLPNKLKAKTRLWVFAAHISFA
jgi:hypothetical protein